MYAWFREPKNRALVKRLLRHVKVLHVEKEKGKGTRSSLFSGKTFVLTGTLSSMSRDEAKAKIKSQGGDVSSAVSSKTNFLVAGADPGSKYLHAEALGVEILDEENFVKMLP